MSTLTKYELDKFWESNDGLSDLDYSYNALSGEYDRPSIEWDGPYGRHWESFDSEEARTARLKEHEEYKEKWVIQFRIDEENRQRDLERERENERAYRMSLQNTLGNLCPNLRHLRFN